MQPARVTDPKLLPILEELREREPIFHRREFGTTRADFDSMMAPEFWEIGASGQRYSREYILDILETRMAHPYTDVWEASDFFCQQLAESVYLLNYNLVQDRTRKTRRTTIWRRSGSAWLIVFHQGTIIQNSAL